MQGWLPIPLWKECAVRKVTIFAVAFAMTCLLSCSTVAREKKAENAEGHYKMGVAYLTENKVQKAFVEFQKALEITPDNRDVLDALGIIYLLDYDEPRKAVSCFEKAVKIDPEFSEGYNNLGYAHSRLGEYETAITYYRKALSNLVYATAEKAYINMGDAYYRLHKYDAALQAYKEAIKRAPKLGLAYLRLSLCYNALGKYGDASSAMAQAIKLDPVYNGDRDKAMEDFSLKKLKASGADEQDFADYIEILRY
jgi:tetratricopeptide (TPR) repeat protein